MIIVNGRRGMGDGDGDGERRKILRLNVILRLKVILRLPYWLASPVYEVAADEAKEAERQVNDGGLLARFIGGRQIKSQKF